MNVISGLKNSGFLAQSAYSASIATKDDLGRDITATYLTSHQDLSDYAKSSALNDYQTIAGMTAYQPAGDYATTAEVESISSMLSGAIDYVSANAGDEFPASANEAITAYQTNSGDYLKESELGYNAVDEVSAINGSAISQYGAEKQWLVHDDTLVHASNSAQYALGCNISALQRLMGIDETVLWINPNPQMVISNTTLTAELSDTISSYKKLRFVCKGSYDYNESFSAAVMNQDFYTNEDNKVNSVGVYLPNRRGDVNYIDCCQIQFSGNVFTANNGIRLQTTNNTGRGPYILSVIGIGRK